MFEYLRNTTGKLQNDIKTWKTQKKLYNHPLNVEGTPFLWGLTVMFRPAFSQQCEINLLNEYVVSALQPTTN